MTTQQPMVDTRGVTGLPDFSPTGARFESPRRSPGFAVPTEESAPTARDSRTRTVISHPVGAAHQTSDLYPGLRPGLSNPSPLGPRPGCRLHPNTGRSLNVNSFSPRRLALLCWPMVLLGGIVITAGLAAHALCDDDDTGEAGVVKQFTFSGPQFDAIVFGGNPRVVIENGQQRVISETPSMVDVREFMESVLFYKMSTIDDRCSLTELQRKKLNLAGRGDIFRWQSRVCELRKKCTSMTMDRQQYTELMPELQSLRYFPQFGQDGETSLFRKTLRTALTDEQQTRYRRLERELRIEAIERALTNWDRGTNGLKLARGTETRRKFIDTLVERGNFPQINNPYMPYIVLLEADRLEDQLKPLLNETQWHAFKTQVVQARRLEPNIRQLAQWPLPAPEDDEETPTDAKKE
ncbi:MAG: hypothetical protein HZA46_13590 [Planctomycetales bacterium]|nr:hypothetical protein [Planctomycetales bacterium]